MRAGDQTQSMQQLLASIRAQQHAPEPKEPQPGQHSDGSVARDGGSSGSSQSDAATEGGGGASEGGASATADGTDVDSQQRGKAVSDNASDRGLAAGGLEQQRRLAAEQSVQQRRRRQQEQRAVLHRRHPRGGMDDVMDDGGTGDVEGHAQPWSMEKYYLNEEGFEFYLDDPYADGRKYEGNVWVDDRDGTTYQVEEGRDGEPGRLTKRLPNDRAWLDGLSDAEYDHYWDNYYDELDREAESQLRQDQTASRQGGSGGVRGRRGL
mmetsp:Transcript_2095/g.6207  ORF Transcript_2095/g.6207 Transcript_2095/m.6207 type:complete len:265 (-) Transcript_2095:10071-10865(-)